MLDDLLGRRSLNERIEELTEERDRLSRRLEAETDRRREAVRDRQAADERVNRLEDRIAELEGRIDRLDTGERELTYRRVESVGGDRLREVLNRLASFSTDTEGALTAMVADDVPPAVRELPDRSVSLIGDAAPCLVVADDLGLVSAAIVPLVPPDPFATWSNGFEIDRSWFLPVGEYTLALVRSDLFAMGTYRDGDRRTYRGFESNVAGQHSKGGFSQRRFERRREEQIQAHLDRCREAIEARSADRLIVVGEQRLLAPFRDEAVATAPVDATGKPEEALAEAARHFWTTRLYIL